MKFPFIGSAVLLSLFIAFRFLPANLVNAALTLYFASLGTAALAAAVLPFVEAVFSAAAREKSYSLVKGLRIPYVLDVSRRKVVFSWFFWRERVEEEEEEGEKREKRKKLTVEKKNFLSLFLPTFSHSGAHRPLPDRPRARLWSCRLPLRPLVRPQEALALQQRARVGV